MERALVEAEPELQRYLSWVSKPTRAKRWLVKHEMWVQREDGVWETEREVPSLHELRRNGRAPVIITGDTMDAIASQHRAKPSQGDINDALRGLEPTLVEDGMGGVREDYARIPLKNADGSLSKYAKNLMDLHAPAAAKGEAVAEKMTTLVAKAKESGAL